MLAGSPPVLVGSVGSMLVCGWESGGVPVSKPKFSGAWNEDVEAWAGIASAAHPRSFPASSSIIYLPSLRGLGSLLLARFRSSLSPLLVTTRPLPGHYSASTLLSFPSVGGNLRGFGVTWRAGAGLGGLASKKRTMKLVHLVSCLGVRSQRGNDGPRHCERGGDYRSLRCNRRFECVPPNAFGMPGGKRVPV